MREREEKVNRVVTLHLTGGNRDTFSAMKVPRQCPLVLLVKAGCRQSKAFGSGEGRAMRGARREVQQGLTALDRNVECSSK
jgi:hypothetical protein